MAIFAIHIVGETLTANGNATAPSVHTEKYLTYSAENTFSPYIEFNTSGLNYEIELTDIFMGNFEAVAFERKGMFFNILFGSYVSTFARQCPEYLPSDKIELTERACIGKTVTKNGYGMIINSTCTQWETRKLGLYADPKMYQVMVGLEQHQLGNMLSMIGNGEDGLGFAAKMTGEMKAIAMDMAKLFVMNTCDSHGLKRFQENLRLFALGQEPIRIDTLIAQRKANKVKMSSNQDLQQLVEDLVFQNSRQWNFNRYQSGSIHDVNVLTTDVNGLPNSVKAYYYFTGFGGKKKGSIRLTFDSKGIPECLYFFDFPTTCRPANRKIVNKYASNAYAASDTPLPMSTGTGSDLSFKNKQQVAQYTLGNGNQEIADVPFAVVENPPIYPGCESFGGNSERKKCFSEKINQFVNQNFNTKLAGELGLSGVNRIIMQFRIDHDGNINNIRGRAAHPELEAEALRIIKLLPKMSPGMQRGKLVGVMYSLPIVFKVSENGNTESTILLNVNKKPNQKAKTKDPSKATMRHLFNLKKDNDGSKL